MKSYPEKGYVEVIKSSVDRVLNLQDNASEGTNRISTTK